MSTSEKTYFSPRRFSLWALFSLVSLFWVISAIAQTPVRGPAIQIEADDAVSGDLFGSSLDADGSVLLVGAPNDRDAGFAGGALYVFERDGAHLAWNQVLEVLPPTTFRKISGGVVSGDTFAYLDTGAEELHIYERDAMGTWREAALLTETDYDFDSLVLDGDDLIVRARTSRSGLRPSKLSHYQRIGGVWVLVDDSLDFFSNHGALALESGTLVYGRRIAVQDASTGLFHALTELPLPAGANTHPSDGFGDVAAIAAGGDRLAMGAFIDDIDGAFSGSVYLYDRDPSGQWDLTARLAPSDPAPFRGFGFILEFTGERLVVLARGNSSQGAASGGFVFDPDTNGAYVETLQLDPGGQVLAVLDDVAFIGQPLVGVGGAAFVYPFEETEAPPQVAINSLAQCPTDSLISVSGSVSAPNSIDRLARSVDGGLEEVICLDCGENPTFAFDVNLLACQENAIEVTAEDSAGQTARDGASVYFDDVDPVLMNCEDQAILIPEGDFFTNAAQPTAADNCELVVFECVNPGDFNWPRFPIGNNQPAFCYAIDRCGREARCEFTVSVEVDDEEGCKLYDFRDEVGGGTAVLSEAPLGDGDQPGVGAWLTDSGLEVFGFGSMLGPEGDNGTFSHRLVNGAFRVETPLPDPEDGSEDPKGGLMVRWGLDTLAARAMVVRSQGSLEFAVRRSAGQLGEPLATSIPFSGVTDLALEWDGQTVKAEYSTDGGETWIQPTGALGGQATVSTGSQPSLAGFIVSSQSDEIIVGLTGGETRLGGTPNKAFFDDASFIFPYLKICDLSDGPPSPGECRVDDFNDGIVDPEWTLVGVGNANQQSVVEAGGVLELTADGATAFYGADNAGFLYREIVGDFRAEVTIDGNPMTTGGIYRKAGLMVRESLDKWDVRLLAQLVPFWQDNDETHLQFVAREAFGEPGRLPVARDVIGVPRVVRLAVTRQGDTLSVEFSIDGGVTWVQPSTGLGGSITIPGLAPTLLVGLDMVSNNISVTSTAYFDDFSLCAE